MLEFPAPRLDRLTTLRLGGTAIAEIVIENEEDAWLLPDRLKKLGGKPFFIGRGSNLLARDGELPLVLIRVNFNRPIQICGESGDKIFVRVQAGAKLKELLRFCLENGLSGLEGLIGIPGSVGGAIAMNAGSFGTETARSIHALTVLGDEGIKHLNLADLLPEYRKIKFVGFTCAPLVLDAIFALTHASNNVIFRRMNLNFLEKKSRQPLTAWSAGCAFKNPKNGNQAGALLESAGFRGKKLGGMAFSEIHANFLVNEGKGSSDAALELMNEAREIVYKNSGIKLEPEVRIIP